MILNDKEKAEVVSALKRQYEDNKAFIENGNFPLWVQSDKQREEFISQNEKIKERYEAIEKGEELEINMNGFNGGNEWALGLIALAFLFGGDIRGNSPDNNSTLN